MLYTYTCRLQGETSIIQETFPNSEVVILAKTHTDADGLKAEYLAIKYDLTQLVEEAPITDIVNHH